MNKEYRKHKRVKPNVQLEVYDVVRESQLGEILNISAGGALIMTQLNLQPGEMYQTHWTFVDGSYKNIAVGLECLWVDIQHSGHRFCGLHIIDISEEDILVIRDIVSKSQEI